MLSFHIDAAGEETRENKKQKDGGRNMTTLHEDFIRCK